jgi:radical SAM protein with 4Fe4S-binding SPASM domain
VRGGRYDRAVSAIGHLLNARFKYDTFIPKLRVSFVKQKLNEHEAERFRAKFQGIAEVTIQQFRDRMGNIRGDFYPSDELVDSDPMSLDLSCGQPFERVFIRYNGNVNPCCNDMEDTLTYGNLARDSLLNLYNNQKAIALRAEIKGKKFNSFCTTCLTDTKTSDTKPREARVRIEFPKSQAGTKVG